MALLPGTRWYHLYLCAISNFLKQAAILLSIVLSFTAFLSADQYTFCKLVTVDCIDDREEGRFAVNYFRHLLLSAGRCLDSYKDKQSHVSYAGRYSDASEVCAVVKCTALFYVI